MIKETCVQEMDLFLNARKTKVGKLINLIISEVYRKWLVSKLLRDANVFLSPKTNLFEATHEKNSI